MHLEAMEDDLKGVRKVSVNFKRQTMAVEYEEGMITAGDIARAVSAMGYTATPEVLTVYNKEKGSTWTKLFRS
jgi:cation transport ATPase